jgi:hypothetical protein
MRRWLDPDWYAYLRARLGPDRILLIGLAALATLFIGGLFAMQALGSGSDSSATATTIPIETTVVRRVKVVEAGKTIAKRVPVIKRVQAAPVTLVQTRTIDTPGGTKIVTKPVVQYRVLPGKDVTVDHVLTHTRMFTNTVVNEHTNTVVQSETQTVNQTVTNVRTRTQTLPADTVTVTGPTKTETVAGPTRTETVTGPTRTETVTTTATVTAQVTVSLPAVTVTVTTTKPH